MFSKYSKFEKTFTVDKDISISQNSILSTSNEAINNLLKKFGGKSFNKGIYRLFASSDIVKWNEIVTNMFPSFRNKIMVFGYDWLGRIFAATYKNVPKKNEQVILFEPGTGEALEIPCNLLEFHNDEIVTYANACLSQTFFDSWFETNPQILRRDQCVGYGKMLFLGGEDIVENLEIIDMDVYWSICSQVFRQIHG
jgi:hypothetical protein